MDPDPRWQEVDDLVERLLIPDDPGDAEDHAVSPPQGKLLYLLARAAGARSILEIGTLGGYSTHWLARSLPPGGRLVTLEIDPDRPRDLPESAELIVGDAHETLPTLTGPFDLIFIDADKRSNPAYLEHSLRLSRPGTLIVADNVVREGALADPRDESARGVREFLERVAADPRLEATAIQTVGSKGWDGFALIRVVDAAR